jgi:hypothetical protein
MPSFPNHSKWVDIPPAEPVDSIITETFQTDRMLRSNILNSRRSGYTAPYFFREAPMPERLPTQTDIVPPLQQTTARSISHLYDVKKML